MTKKAMIVPIITKHLAEADTDRRIDAGMMYLAYGRKGYEDKGSARGNRQTMFSKSSYWGSYVPRCGGGQGWLARNRADNLLNKPTEHAKTYYVLDKMNPIPMEIFL